MIYLWITRFSVGKLFNHQVLPPFARRVAPGSPCYRRRPLHRACWGRACWVSPLGPGTNGRSPWFPAFRFSRKNNPLILMNLRLNLVESCWMRSKKSRRHINDFWAWCWSEYMGCWSGMKPSGMSTAQWIGFRRKFSHPILWRSCWMELNMGCIRVLGLMFIW